MFFFSKNILLFLFFSKLIYVCRDDDDWIKQKKHIEEISKSGSLKRAWKIDQAGILTNYVQTENIFFLKINKFVFMDVQVA